MSSDHDFLFLLRNTVPVPGEFSAAAESWWNVLSGNTDLSRDEINREIARASTMWRSRALAVTRTGEG